MSKTIRNPNRVQRTKLNLRPDQVKKLNNLKGSKHQTVRKVLDIFFSEMDRLGKIQKLAQSEA